MIELTEYVNCLMGTHSDMRFSEGNTLPLVQVPFGFSSFSPVTNSERGSWFFNSEDKCFEGFRLTHQPSPWIKDHGALEFLVQSGEPQLAGAARRSGFSENHFPGDEDNGSMSAWFVFAALGKYPICPGRAELVSFNGLCRR